MLLQLWQHVSEIASANMGEVVEREDHGNTNEHDQRHLPAGFPIDLGNQVGSGDIDGHASRDRKP